MARQKFGISRQCETLKASIDVSKWRLKRVTGQHDLTKLCLIEPTVNFHAEPSPGEQDGQPKEPNHRGSGIEYDGLPPSVRFCWRVNPQIQSGWRTSALIRVTRTLSAHATLSLRREALASRRAASRFECVRLQCRAPLDDGVIEQFEHQTKSRQFLFLDGAVIVTFERFTYDGVDLALHHQQFLVGFRGAYAGNHG